MKQVFTFLAVIMMAMALPKVARAYDFSAMNAESNYRTLYFNIITDSTVEVTDYNFYNRSISGLLKIPSHVSYNGYTYSVTKISSGAFSLCENITSLRIPETVIDLGQTSSDSFHPFIGCNKITSIQVDTNNPIYDSRNFCNAIINTSTNTLVCGCKTTAIPNSVERIGYGAFSHCSNLTSITLPNNMSQIEPHAFSYCTRLKFIQIPDGVDTIGYMAFMCCDSLETITIPNSVRSFGSSVFEKCHRLNNVVLPDSINSIPWYLFRECTSLSSIIIPNNVSVIGQHAFEICSNLYTVSLPSSITILDKYVFNGCYRLESISIPASVVSIEDYAFQGCSSLFSISIPDSVVSIGNSAFSGCSNLGTIIFGKDLSSIQDNAFKNCDRVKGIVFPRRLKSIGYSSFSQCDSLETIILQDSLESINGMAFNSCPNLTAIYISTTVPPSIGINTSSFQLYNYNTKIYVPCGTTDLYRNTWACSILSTNYSEDWLPHNITVTTNNGEWGTVSITSCSPIATLTATPEYGYHFVRWSDGNNDNPRVMNISQDTSLAAIFEETIVVINHSSNDLNKGVTMGPDSCILGGNITIAAIPYSGFKFSHWSNGILDNPYILTIMQDTSLVAYFSYMDTAFINIHDTTIVTDTITLTEYVPIHDTTYIDVYDTSYISVPMHDTTIITDTVMLTEYVPIHDTTYINIPVHDTTVVTDTVMLTEYVPVHDTTYITLTDTVTNTVYDTVTNTVFDTIDNYIYDTLTVTVTDTLWLTLYDTITVHDTIIIHDTIVVGVDDVETVNAKIYTSNGQIVVEGAEGNDVWLYDVNGRVIQAIKQSDNQAIRFSVPASGTYLIKIGNYPARKVVVIK